MRSTSHNQPYKTKPVGRKAAYPVKGKVFQVVVKSTTASVQVSLAKNLQEKVIFLATFSINLRLSMVEGKLRAELAPASDLLLNFLKP